MKNTIVILVSSSNMSLSDRELDAAEEQRSWFALRDARIRWSNAKSRVTYWNSCSDEVRNEYHSAKEALFEARHDVKYADQASNRRAARIVQDRIDTVRPKITIMRNVRMSVANIAVLETDEKIALMRVQLSLLTTHRETLAYEQRVARVTRDVDYMDLYQTGSALVYSIVPVPDVLLALIVEYAYA